MRAVDGVSLEIARGETVGLVGESGCGKSTFARAVLALVRPTAGEVVFDGTSLNDLPTVEMRRMRRRMQMIFQDSFASLSPRMKVSDIIAEPIDIHRRFDASRRRRRVEEVMRLVGLDPALASRYPHEFSGGQRQRINIARALAPEPDFIVCDEPVSSLDVSIQAQIVNLLASLQRRLGLTLLFISHDLAVVRHLCNRIAVMYLGRLVEVTGRERLVEQPCHPYTRALLSAMALSCGPELLIADEPATALDVTVQDQVLDLMRRLKREIGMAIIWISHDLGTVAGLADRVLIMYAGRIMEEAPVRTLYRGPRHPCTRALLRSIPRLDGGRSASLHAIDGMPPDLVAYPKGCPFHARCPLVADRCRERCPELESVAPGHRVACWRHDDATGD